MSKYSPRLVDDILIKELRAFGAVCITGPKYCGKTTSAERISASTLRMQDRSENDRNLILAKINPQLLLEGDKPRLIDEWQIAPQLWDAIRVNVDSSGETGQFILTGSVNVDGKNIHHSGTGRIDTLVMSTFSLFESEDSNGCVSLKDLFDKKRGISGTSNKELKDVAKIITRGGWPQSIGKDDETTAIMIRGYCESIVRAENYDEKLDPQHIRSVLKSLSRNVAYPLKKSTVENDTGLSEYMISKIMTYLHKTYVLEELASWNTNFRSKTSIRTSPIIHFCDPAIAAYFLSASADDLLADPATFGLLFESLVIHDLRIYARTIDGDVYHYRDKYGTEADAIIHLHDGRWGAVEVKLGHGWVEEAATSLKKVVERVDTTKAKEPSFLAVIIPSGFAYTREDGVHVIPLTCLKN